MQVKKFLLCFLSFCLFVTVVPNVANADENENLPAEQLIDNEVFDQTTVILQAIEDIPQSVLDQGPQATAIWFQETTGLYVTVDSEDNLHFSEVKPNLKVSRSVAGCIAAVGIALVTNAFSFTKITKIKSAIKALGGTTKAVKTIKKYYDEFRYNGFSRKKSISKALDKASEGLSKSVKDALLDFFNLTNVVANCF
ncbi:MULTISPECIES: hypothetical protein [Bacillales]|uniref:Secreted protein n=1 Tax=Brevibacillus aydinogluensis TaxID=927786 RepID=A0AA48MDC1_9BACL|nr:MULTISPECIES: hypothetical protein [Bacillales]CAJ1004169.1 Secreted protein [Brevibacillus aydinogluensis]